MTREERFLQRNRKVAQSRRGDTDTVYNQSFNAYRDDVGWKMSDEQYASFKEDEAEFNTALSEGYSKIDDARTSNSEVAADLNKQEAELGKLKSTSLDDQYKTYSKSFIPVRVTNGNKVEATYMLPKEVASSLSNKLSKDFYTGWFNNGKTLNVDVRAKGGVILGDELHSAFSSGVEDVKASFYKANSGAVKSANQELADLKATGAASIATSRTNLANNETALAGEYDT